MPRLFALDHNFPTPIVTSLAAFQTDAELVRVDEIDVRLPTLDDWELLLALQHHARPWDGLITTDGSMLLQGREIAALVQAKLTLVVAQGAGHDPVKASGLLFAYLAGICRRTEAGRAQVWKLSAVDRPARDPWDVLKRFAEHRGESVAEARQANRLPDEVLQTNPLAP